MAPCAVCEVRLRANARAMFVAGKCSFLCAEEVFLVCYVLIFAASWSVLHFLARSFFPVGLRKRTLTL